MTGAIKIEVQDLPGRISLVRPEDMVASKPSNPPPGSMPTPARPEGQSH